MNKGALLLLALLSGCESHTGCDGGSCNDAGTYDAGRPLPKCLGPDSGLGDPCVCPSDCVNGALCLSELQFGYPRGICLTQGADGGTVGMRTCNATQKCRVGWVCNIFAPGPDGLCDPMCSADSDCPSSGHCDLNTGFCQDDPPGKDFDDVCERDLDCKSGNCPIIASDLGLCRSYCNVARGACPGDGVCKPYSNPVPGDEYGHCEAP